MQNTTATVFLSDPLPFWNEQLEYAFGNSMAMGTVLYDNFKIVDRYWNHGGLHLQFETAQDATLFRLKYI